MSTYGSDTDALAIFTALTADDTITITPVDLTDFAIPGGDWLQAVNKLTNADITTKQIDGTGTFDVIMSALAVHLKNEYNANRITGAEYTKAYIAMVQAALASSIQFVLGKDQSFWQAMQAQAAAIQAKVELESAKLRYAGLQLEVLTGKANYALAKIRLATEDIAFGSAKFNLENMLPKQLEQANAQISQLTAQTTGITYTNEHLLPKQVDQANAAIAQSTAQTAAIEAQTVGVQYTNLNLLPKQVDLATQQINQSVAQVLQIGAQTVLIEKQQAATVEQMEATRAQTMNTRSDGITNVTGLLGKQKDLYAQQITSYQRDAEIKAAKIFSDAWITMLTINETTPVPDSFANTNLEEILSTVKTNNSL